jgi:hypothetical protein
MLKNADKLLFRASSMGKLNTNDKSGKNMGETAIKELIKIYAREAYGRRDEIKSKYLDKGNLREEDSITLLARNERVFFKKNDQRLTNEFFSGEPDIFIGESVDDADETYDTKSSWSLFTFLESRNSKAIDKDYFCQGQVYMDLTGAKRHTIAYCLVNGTADQITKEKKALLWEMSETDPQFKEKCKQIEINHIFDIAEFQKENPWFDFDNDLSCWEWDIPREERIHKVTFERDDTFIQQLRDRVQLCREYMNHHFFKLQPQLA